MIGLHKKKWFRWTALLLTGILWILSAPVTSSATTIDYKTTIVNASSCPTVEFSPASMEEFLGYITPLYYGDTSRNIVLNYGNLPESDQKNLEYVTSEYCGHYPFATLSKGYYDNSYGHVYLNTTSKYLMYFYLPNNSGVVVPHTTTVTTSNTGYYITNGNIFPSVNTTTSTVSSADQTKAIKTVRKARLIAAKAPDSSDAEKMAWILSYLNKNYDKKNTVSSYESTTMLTYNYLIKKKTVNPECRYATASLIARYCNIPCIYVPVIKSGSIGYALLFVDQANDNKLYYVAPGSTKPHKITDSDKIVIEQYNMCKWLLANEIYIMAYKEVN